MNTIGERLREERVRLGMSQSAFGATAGVTKTTQINYEKGARAPDAEYLAAAHRIGVDIHYVIAGVRSAAADLQPEESALVENYRAAGEEGKSSLRAVGAALAQQGMSNGKAKDG